MIPRKDDYDAIVVGGGPAGVTFSYCMAKLGKKVLILDKKPLDKIGDKTCGDALNHSAPAILYREFGLEPPKGDEITDTIDSISVLTDNSHLKLDEKGYTVDRHIYGQRLLNDCKEAGVEVLPNCPVRDITVEGGFVTGVTFVNRNLEQPRKQTLYARVIVDSSGTFGAVRSKLPEELAIGIHNKIPDNHIAASYREIVEMKEAHEFPNDLALSYHNDIPPPGYLWYFSKGEKRLNIGTGWLKTENVDGSMKSIFRNAVAGKYRAEVDYQVEIVGGGQIPIRPPFDSLVFNGGMLIGDSGCLVDPVTAEGHGNAMVCGMYAAQVANEAISLNDVSRAKLWSYNVKVMDHYGRRNAISYVTLKYLRELGAEGMDKIFRKKMLTKDELQSVFRGETPRLGVKDLVVKAKRSFPNFGLLKTLTRMVKEIKSISYIYARYPKNPDAFDQWRADRDYRLQEVL